MRTTFPQLAVNLLTALLTRPATVSEPVREAVLARAAATGGATRSGTDVPLALAACVDRVGLHAYKVTDADFESAYAAGWSDDAIRDAIVVACLFNFMNRLVSTLGIEAGPAYLAAAGPRIRDEGYTGSLKKFSATTDYNLPTDPSSTINS